MSTNTGNVAKKHEKTGMKTSDNSCTVQVIDSLEQWQPVAEGWNTLLAKSLSNTIFLTWEWLFSWAKCFLNPERKLFVICIYQSEQLIGIAPFYLRQQKNKLPALRQIRFLGSPETGSDYLDVIIQKGKEKLVAGLLYEYLYTAGRAQWDELRLTDIPSESLFLLHFLNRVEEQGKFSEIHRCAVMPQTKLPEQKDTFLLSLSSNRRERFRRDMRRLHQEGEAEHIIHDGTD